MKRTSVEKFLPWMLTLISTTASAAIFVTDEAAFLSAFENPTEIIDFTSLRDGTTYATANTSNPYINSTTHTSGGIYEVWENGWSENFLIRSTNGSFYHLVTRWDGTSVGINNPSAPRFSIFSLTGVAPLSLSISSDTYTGFLGIIPESDIETHYQFYYPGLRVSEIRAGYSQVSRVPEPPAFALVAAGIFGLLGGKRITRNSWRQQSWLGRLTATRRAAP